MENSSTTESIQKVKTSKLAIASLVLIIIGLFVSSFRMFMLILTLAVILGIVAIVKIKRSKGRLKGRWMAVFAIAISVILLLLVGIFCFLSLDAPPIPDDYTISDLRSAGPEYAESYQLLISLADEEVVDPNSAPAIGLSAQDIDTMNEIYDRIKMDDHGQIAAVVAANAESIERIWLKTQKGRDVIHQLNGFGQIADLTEPSLEANINFVFNLRRLAMLYNLQLFLKCEQGINDSGLDEFLELDSVFRKISINSRTTMTELVCYISLRRGIQAANFIANNPLTSRESMETLEGHFLPLTEEQLSLKNSLISEYLVSKNALDKILEKWGVGNRRNPVLKRNSFMRVCKNYYDFQISTMEDHENYESAELSVWPSIYRHWLPHVHVDQNCKLPLYYTWYNPIGSMLFQILAPSYEKIFERKKGIEVYDDLLQIVLNKRLGKPVSLKARAYSDEYIIDVEKRIIYSPGPDGESYTEDDIKLPINPEVLNLTE